ncbi:unnamed protein product [Diabrotica balteata]|uniref:DH domain-containing protein n=1 Tax=Diabrotica balteata TaxID=107213 RepID=A0A9N9SPV4_DIABA|nr:unnamed protein product [Diabrotica balteata]
MASSDKDKTKVVGEILVAWKKYTASSDDEINLLEGDVVELLDINDPNPSKAVVKELIETEIEFVRDLDLVVQRYLIPSESGKVPKIIKDNFDLVFGNFKEIAEFHRT